MYPNVLKFFFRLLPYNSPFLYRLARHYVDVFNNDNNCDFFTNGEALLLNKVVADISLRDCVVFDIGANIGDWSSYLLTLKPNAYIHMFEPSHKTFHELCRKSWPKNITFNNFALGSKIENLSLNVQGTAGTNSFHDRSSTLGTMDNELVHISTLDQYCGEHSIKHIDFMKIDVEGHELSVLEGAQGMLSNGAISVVQFEYGGTFLDARIQLNDAWHLLASFGYRIAKVYPGSLKFYENYSQELESFKYSNWVAVYDF